MTKTIHIVKLYYVSLLLIKKHTRQRPPVSNVTVHHERDNPSIARRSFTSSQRANEKKRKHGRMNLI